MPADRTYAQLVADYLVATVEADGTFVRLQASDILVDTATEAHVEARFGASAMLATFRGAARPVLRSGTILTIVDERRERPEGTGGLGEVVAYEYDLIDEPYGSELGFHDHWEARSKGVQVHRHERTNGGKRVAHRGPGERSVTLEEALMAFRARLWANRYPGR